MSSFSIKQGDLVPAITATLLQTVSGALVPIDLTAATAVRFAMRNRRTGALKVDAVAAVVLAAAGTVKYQWAGTDTDTAGAYDTEWQITWAAGKQSIPSSGYDVVRIGDDLAT